MGQSKLFGGGSGKPVNAVKVTETAIKDIPANCFVSKKQGSDSFGVFSYSDSNVSSNVILHLSNDVYIIFAGTQVCSIFNEKVVQTSNISTSTSVVFELHSRHWIIVPAASTLIKVENDGTFTIENFTIPTDFGTPVNGIYPSDIVYSIVYTSGSSMETSGYSLVKWQLNAQNSLNKISTTFIETTPGSGSYGKSYSDNPKYIAEADLIVSCCKGDNNTYQLAVLKASTVTSVLDEYSFSPVYGNSSIYNFCTKIKTGDALIHNGKIYIFNNSYYTNGVYNAGYDTIDISTGITTQAYIKNGITDSKSVYSVAAVKYSESYWYILLCKNNTKAYYIIPFNPDTEQGGTPVVQISGTTNTVLNDQLLEINKPQFLVWNFRNESSSYTYTYSPGHIEVSDGTIYGLSQNPIKAHEQGNVYCVDTSYPDAAYTAYGITEALATQIIDDSVDEIKQEVQNG